MGVGVGKAGVGWRGVSGCSKNWIKCKFYFYFFAFFFSFRFLFYFISVFFFSSKSKQNNSMRDNLASLRVCVCVCVYYFFRILFLWLADITPGNINACATSCARETFECLNTNSVCHFDTHEWPAHGRSFKGEERRRGAAKLGQHDAHRPRERVGGRANGEWEMDKQHNWTEPKRDQKTNRAERNNSQYLQRIPCKMSCDSLIMSRQSSPSFYSINDRSMRISSNILKL